MSKINKYFLALVLPASLLGSCGNNGQGTSDEKNDSTAVVTGADTVTFTIEDITKEQYCEKAFGKPDCDPEKMWPGDSLMDLDLLKEYPGYVNRKGNDIEVITKKGKQLFKSKIDPSGMSDDVEQYYVAYIGQKLVALKVYYYESYDYVVVDTETGESFHTWGHPSVNKTGNKVIAGNTDLVAGFTNNGLQLFVKDNAGKWNLKMEKMLDDWGPDWMGWVDDNTVYSKKMSMTMTDSGEVYKTEYIKVLLKEEKMN